MECRRPRYSLYVFLLVTCFLFILYSTGKSGFHHTPTGAWPALFSYGSLQGHKDSSPQVLTSDIRTTMQSSPESFNRTEVKLIISTYMRSGSTLTGDVFNSHPEVFYVFEPLWAVEAFCRQRNETAFYLDKDPADCKGLSKDELEKTYTETIRDFLDCRFQSVHLRTLLGSWVLKQSLTTSPFFECTTKHPGILGVQACLSLLTHACQQARVRSLKTIRFKMKQVEELMRTDPRIKVVHLLRDPRGTLRGQHRYSLFKRSQLDNYSRRFCQVRLQEDLTIADKLRLAYPGRVMTARYEDLATKPLAYAEHLLKFAGLDMPDKLVDHILNITSRNLTNEDCPLCIGRSNSSRTATAWRQKTDFNFVACVDKNCGNVYQRMGYLPLATFYDLTNKSVPTFKDSDAVPWIWRS